jgi:nucleotide-binding universal stress UspA family protein
MHGTVVCAVADGTQNDDAVAEATELSERLGLRLVLTHVVDRIAGLSDDDGESITMKGDRIEAERRLAELARAHGVEESAEQRVVLGDPAALLGRIASEEAADMIIVGAKRRGWGRRGVESRLAHELETETPVPVLIAPPRRHARPRLATNDRQR